MLKSFIAGEDETHGRKHQAGQREREGNQLQLLCPFCLHNAPVSYHCNQAACRVIQQKQCEVLGDLHKISTGLVHNWVNYPPAIKHGNGCNGTSPFIVGDSPLLCLMTPESIEIYSTSFKCHGENDDQDSNFVNPPPSGGFLKWGFPPSHEF